jgi:hypothetical protein
MGSPPRSWLLAVYAAGPLMIVAVLLDTTVLGRALLGSAPTSPALLPGYALVFGMPHILASFFAFADPALARSCAPVLRPAFAWSALAALAVAPFVGQSWADGMIVGWTMVHVLGQQSGLALGQALGRSGLLGTRRWTLVALVWRGLLAAVGVAAGLALGGEAGWKLVEAPAAWMQAAGVLLCLSTPLAAALAWAARQHGGDPRALLALQATVSGSWALVLAGYPLLGIVLLRLVHDVSAFLFYAAFANAREAAQPGANRLYRVLGLAGRRPGPWLWPLASGLVLLLAPVVPVALSLWLVFAHYLAEHRLWRHDSPLRGPAGATIEAHGHSR